MRNLDKFRGCLLGGAAGDALGYEVEFLSSKAILNRFGESGITEYCLHNGVAEISDDTQMTLFTATGLLLGTTRGMNRGIMGSYENYIRSSYEDWLCTQTEPFPLSDNIFHYSWLINVPQLFSRRAPGNTCLSALRSGENGSIENPINRSKGCGGVMRVAPIGLYFCDKQLTISDSDKIGAKAAAITHGHTLGWLPAAALVHIIRRLAENEKETVLHAVLDSMEALKQNYADVEHIDALLSLMQKAIDLSSSSLDDLDAIRSLGEGWVAEETLAIAIYCALKYPSDIEKALIAAVNHDGDSDSTGAVTGNILGASLGASRIPQKFIDHLELREIISEVADDLWHDCQMTEYGDDSDPAWEAKYIHIRYPNETRKASY